MVATFSGNIWAKTVLQLISEQKDVKKYVVM